MLERRIGHRHSVGVTRRELLQVGYSGLLVAILAFGIEIITEFTGVLSTVAAIGLAVGIVVLPIPIVLGYGVMAANREDRGGGSFH